jgi:hypothetical protein
MNQNQNHFGGSSDEEEEKTGSWANCIAEETSTDRPAPRQLLSSEHREAQPDDTVTRYTTVSCHQIEYRVKLSSFRKAKEIIIGVLSGASGLGPQHRQTIRHTWANTTQYDNPTSGHTTSSSVQSVGVFFLVAGPWSKEMQTEFDTFGDLIWINEEEIYNGEQSVLTYKTQSFIRIVHDLGQELKLDIQYVFKTDDDSYIHIPNLYNELLLSSSSSSSSSQQQKENNQNDIHRQARDYWGWCQLNKFPPKRDDTAKWPVSFELYPEPMYPRYCQGAGFALSWKFITCAATDDNIGKIRFLPFEDAAIGLLAERCSVVPTMVEKRRWINLYRTDLQEEKDRVKYGLAKIDKSKLTKPIMLNRIVQHRIYDDWDMEEHHKLVMDPQKYSQESTVQWYHPPKE